MKYKPMLAMVFVLGIILAACAPQAAAVPTMTTQPTTAPTEATVSETETPTASPVPVATDTGVAETPTGGIPVTGAATVNVSDVYGVWFDPRGR